MQHGVARDGLGRGNQALVDRVLVQGVHVGRRGSAVSIDA
jgi:hypothetical protein